VKCFSCQRHVSDPMLAVGPSRSNAMKFIVIDLAVSLGKLLALPSNNVHKFYGADERTLGYRFKES